MVPVMIGILFEFGFDSCLLFGTMDFIQWEAAILYYRMNGFF